MLDTSSWTRGRIRVDWRERGREASREPGRWEIREVGRMEATDAGRGIGATANDRAVEMPDGWRRTEALDAGLL
jgi:hypothetical protein